MKTLFFIGFMGVGKTSVSAALGRMLKLPVIEMDQQIARQEGMTIPEIFAQKGEGHFRRCETALLEGLADGAVYANLHGESGYCPARKLEVKDTTGAGDAFCAGAAIGLTYGKGLKEACEIGAMLAASVIVTSESVCPRFRPRELGLDMDVED